ncbi:MAG: metal-dependent transcriptional regulator [Anaerolineae bacterium]|nr:metal-dependent transcriptional regulator [Anaerolineae bacterium]
MELSPQIEDYLKNIYQLQTRYGRVPTTALAERLAITAASVTGMVRKLAGLGLVDHEPYHGVRLTASGESLALQIVRAHRLWELYLVQALEVPWDQAHVEAEQLEHALSQGLADRLAEVLGHPTADPHGHPIPSRNGDVARRGGVPLDHLPAGEAGVVVQIRDDTPELLRYLGKLGIYPGEHVAVLDVAPFEGPLRVQIGDRTEVLGRRVAGHVMVHSEATLHERQRV